MTISLASTLNQTQRLSVSAHPLQLSPPIHRQDLSSDFHPAFFTDINPHYKTAIKPPIVFLHKYQASIGQRLTPGHLTATLTSNAFSEPAQLGTKQCHMTEALSLLTGNLSQEVALKLTSSPLCSRRLSVPGSRCHVPSILPHCVSQPGIL